jgi:hypothetical protein
MKMESGASFIASKNEYLVHINCLGYLSLWSLILTIGMWSILEPC